MYFTKLVIAAFIALVHAAPVPTEELDARTNRVQTVPIIKDNDNNVFVIGQSKGGNGGKNTANQGNVAIPVAAAGKNNGKIKQDVSQGNEAYQYADGGSAVVAGKYTPPATRDFEERGRQAFPVFKDNDGNTFVLGSATGGNGGKNEANQGNVAIPVAFSGKNKGKVSQNVAQSNAVGQSADGGDAVVAGHYARHADDDDLEARGYTFPSFIDNDRNTVVVGTAKGGKGGKNTANQGNIAAPIAFSGFNSGKTSQNVQQGNGAEQYADGGSAAVIGKSGSKRDVEELEARRQGSLVYVGPVLSDNDNNVLVAGDSKGGKGGINKANQINAAAPIAIVAGKNNGKVKQDVAQANAAGQSADGGSAGVIGIS